MVDHENILTRKFFARNFLTRKFPELRYLYPPKHMAVLDYSRLFQAVPELDCATTNTLTVIGDTLR